MSHLLSPGLWKLCLWHLEGVLHMGSWSVMPSQWCEIRVSGGSLPWELTASHQGLIDCFINCVSRQLLPVWIKLESVLGLTSVL